MIQTSLLGYGLSSPFPNSHTSNFRNSCSLARTPVRVRVSGKLDISAQVSDARSGDYRARIPSGGTVRIGGAADLSAAQGSAGSR